MNPFNHLCWQEKITYGSLLFFITATIFAWRLGIIAMIILIIASIVQSVTLRKFGNHTLTKLQKYGFTFMFLFWIVYAISVLYSTNKANAWETLECLLPFIIFPLLFIINDSTYLTHDRIKCLFYALVTTLIVRSVACSIVDIILDPNGIPFMNFNRTGIDSFDLHHNYLALYINVALVFLIHEITHEWNKRSHSWRIAMIGSAIILLYYLLLSQSRSGIVVLLIWVFIFLIYHTFFQHNWGTTLVVIGIILLTMGIVYWKAPNVFDRFNALIIAHKEGRLINDRTLLFKYGLMTAKDQILFGYGSGDYMEFLLNTYEQVGYTIGITKKYGTHNQYLETLLQTGLIGLTILLVTLLYPIYLSFKSKSNILFNTLIVATITSSILFESMFNRQMGIQFISLIYSLILINPPYPQKEPSRNGL